MARALPYAVSESMQTKWSQGGNNSRSWACRSAPTTCMTISMEDQKSTRQHLSSQYLTSTNVLMTALKTLAITSWWSKSFVSPSSLNLGWIFFLISLRSRLQRWCWAAQYYHLATNWGLKRGSHMSFECARKMRFSEIESGALSSRFRPSQQNLVFCCARRVHARAPIYIPQTPQAIIQALGLC